MADKRDPGVVVIVMADDNHATAEALAAFETAIVRYAQAAGLDPLRMIDTMRDVMHHVYGGEPMPAAPVVVNAPGGAA